MMGVGATGAATGARADVVADEVEVVVGDFTDAELGAPRLLTITRAAAETTRRRSIVAASVTTDAMFCTTRSASFHATLDARDDMFKGLQVGWGMRVG